MRRSSCWDVRKAGHEFVSVSGLIPAASLDTQIATVDSCREPWLLPNVPSPSPKALHGPPDSIFASLCLVDRRADPAGSLCLLLPDGSSAFPCPRDEAAAQRLPTDPIHYVEPQSSRVTRRRF